MSGSDPARERAAAARLRQRLWGAAVLIALAVLVLPLLLDGAGSESRFRRVEKLREEPPRILRSGDPAETSGSISRDAPDGDASADAGARPDAGAGAGAETGVEAGTEAGTEAVSSGLVESRERRSGTSTRTVQEGIGESGNRPGDVREGGADDPSTRSGQGGDASPRAWVVQAGSFRDRENALAVLDRLRRAGHASFVTDVDRAGETWHRVQAGPMADKAHAEALRDEVASLLGREAIVVPYP